MTEATPPASGATPNSTPQTGANPAQGTPAPAASAGEYDSRSFGAGVTKAKAEAAKELADLRARLAKFEDTDKTAEQLKTERDKLTAELETFRTREAKRLEAAKAEATATLKTLPAEAAALINVDGTLDADELRARLGAAVALVGKQAKVPGGTVSPQGSGIDLTALEEARKSGLAARYADEVRKAHAKYGRDAVNKALGG